MKILKYRINTIKVQLIISLFFIIGMLNVQAQNLYWIGGSGNWTNPTNWSNTSGGPSASTVPDATKSAIFDINSGLSNGNSVVIPTGTHNVLDLRVIGITANFKFNFNATTGGTYMNIHGDLTFLSTHSIQYGSAYYVWYFHGKSPSAQKINTAGKNMNNAEFINENVNYELNSNFNAGEFIRFHAGTLKTLGHDINTDLFLLKDDNGSCCPATKIIIAGTSTIDCQHFDAGPTYGSLTMYGDYSIRTEIFEGPGSSPYDPPNVLNDIYLKDYEASSNFFDNNFRCSNCEIDKVIIENIHSTRFANNFTVNELFEVQTAGVYIVFNTTSGNSDEVTFNGIITTPSLTNCQGNRVTFTNMLNEVIYFLKDGGSLIIEDAELSNVVADGTANFELHNGNLTGSSSGWTMIGAPVTRFFTWKGTAGDSLWSNPLNWDIIGSGLQCVPTINDNVILNNPSFSTAVHVIIPVNYTASCKNLSRTSNTETATIYMRGDFAVGGSALRVSGNCILPDNTSFDYSSLNGDNKVIFTSNASNTITCPFVQFPHVVFNAENGDWTLMSDFAAHSITNGAGTFKTNDNSVETIISWSITEDFLNNIDLGNSNIQIGYEMNLGGFYTNNINFNPGTSHIIAENLGGYVPQFYNVTLTNSNPINLENSRFIFNKLELAGNNITSTKSIVVDSLIFISDGTELLIADGDSLIINKAIISTTSAGNPAKINSEVNSESRILYNNTGNICVDGPVDFRDIDVDINGALHAPNGINSGNNTNIDFSNSPVLTPLYWIGKKGEWNIKSNWSNVSGGCPVNKNPNTANKLIFDNNSFTSNHDTITLPLLTNCKTLSFENSTFPAIFDVQTRWNPLQIFIHGVEVHFTGAKMYVQVKTEVLANSELNIDITEGADPKFDTPILNTEDNSNVNIKQNTKVIVRN